LIKTSSHENRPPRKSPVLRAIIACTREKVPAQDIDPGDTWQLKSEEHARSFWPKREADERHAREALRAGAVVASAHLSGDGRAGKDGTIKHVMSGINRREPGHLLQSAIGQPT